jgi:hypothetical protein
MELDQSTMDRRRFLTRAAVTIAWTTPVIWSLSQSRAGAQTCPTPEGGCNDHGDCADVQSGCKCSVTGPPGTVGVCIPV